MIIYLFNRRDLPNYRLRHITVGDKASTGELKENEWHVAIEQMSRTMDKLLPNKDYYSIIREYWLLKPANPEKPAVTYQRLDKNLTMEILLRYNVTLTPDVLKRLDESHFEFSVHHGDYDVNDPILIMDERNGPMLLDERDIPTALH